MKNKAKILFQQWWHHTIVQTFCNHYFIYPQQQRTEKSGPQEVIFFNQKHVCKKCEQPMTFLGRENIEFSS